MRLITDACFVTRFRKCPVGGAVFNFVLPAAYRSHRRPAHAPNPARPIQCPPGWPGISRAALTAPPKPGPDRLSSPHATAPLRAPASRRGRAKSPPAPIGFLRSIPICCFLPTRYSRIVLAGSAVEEMGMKNFVVALSFAFLSSVVLTTSASAGRMNGVGNCSGGTCTKVTCPVGTCSKAGTADAYDVRYCSAKNCKK